MNFNLVWFPPTVVTFPALRKSQCTRQVLGSEVTAKEREYFLSLRDSVVGCDVMVDKLVIKDVQLTAANDDNYFVFEDQIYNTMLCFSRDTEVGNKYFYRGQKPKANIYISSILNHSIENLNM